MAARGISKNLKDNGSAEISRDVFEESKGGPEVAIRRIERILELYFQRHL